MKRSILSGLAILLPLFITFWIVRLVVLTLGYPFLPPIEAYLSQQPLLANSPHVVLIASYLMILTALGVIITVVGFLVRSVILNWILHRLHWLFDNIPFVNKIYKASKEVVETLFKDEKKNFGKAVLVPFPSEGLWCIGFITQDHVGDDETPVSVLLPNTPLPTIGFLVYYKKNQLRPLNLSLEEAFKIVISGGLLLPSSCGEIPTPIS